MTIPDLGANLVAMFSAVAARKRGRPFLWSRHEGAFVPWSWDRVGREALLIARCLRSHGVAPGDRVLLVGENRPEWCVADLAILMNGSVTVPAYATNSADDHAWILEHSACAAAIVSDGPAGARALAAAGGAPGVRLVITMAPVADPPTGVSPALAWKDALAAGEGAGGVDGPPDLGWDDLACFIYTSGTGGQPKAVMLSHRNIASNIRGPWALLERLGLGDEVFLSFLPLSHAYEHSVGQFLPLALGAEIYYAGGVETLASDLVDVRPTIVTCVPRLFEVMRGRITKGVDREGGWKARLFHEAVRLGERRYVRGGRLPPHRALVDAALERLVREKVRARFGGRLKALVSGGAPLNRDVGRFFLSLGLPLLQGYGQTEASPVVSVNPPWDNRIETVGPPLDGVEVRIAEDGEILVRGELVMRGYWNDPEATAQVLRGGWLHTGDIGAIDTDGYITITDRKKDIIVNSGGDNIAPQRVEGMLLFEPEIAQALVYGDKRPHLVALIVPSDELRRSDGGMGDAPAPLRAAVGAAVDRANRKLSAIERVRRFHVLDEPFTVENGLMTPTLKLRRHLGVQRFRDVLERLYG